MANFLTYSIFFKNLDGLLPLVIFSLEIMWIEANFVLKSSHYCLLWNVSTRSRYSFYGVTMRHGLWPLFSTLKLNVWDKTNSGETKYNSDMYERFLELFMKLPLCAIIDSKYFAVHGGISPKLNNLCNFGFIKIKSSW